MIQLLQATRYPINKMGYKKGQRLSPKVIESKESTTPRIAPQAKTWFHNQSLGRTKLQEQDRIEFQLLGFHESNSLLCFNFTRIQLLAQLQLQIDPILCLASIARMDYKLAHQLLCFPMPWSLSKPEKSMKRLSSVLT